MNKDQLAALTDIERLDYQKLDPVTDAWATRWLTALADTRLELQQAKDSRDGFACDLDHAESEVARQREDIRRLLEAAEAVCAKACLTGRKGEDGWTYQVGRDGDAALRALAAVWDEFAAKYQKGAE